MSSATLKRLLLAFAGLIVIWLGMTIARSLNKDSLVKFDLPRFDRAGVDGMRIIHGNDDFTFVKTGNTWTVNGYPTSPNSVEGVLDAAADSSVHGEVLAESAALHEELGVSDSTGHLLTLTSGGNVVLQVILGGRSKDDFTGYLRMPAQNTVYQMRGQLTALVDKTLDGWRDRRVLMLVTDSIQAIEVMRSGGNYRAVRTAEGWSVDGARGDSAAINVAVGLTRILQASAFATPAQSDSISFAKPSRSIKYLGRNGKPLASMIFDSTAKGYWARLNGKPEVFRLEGWVVDALLPEKSTIRQ